MNSSVSFLDEITGAPVHGRLIGVDGRDYFATPAGGLDEHSGLFKSAAEYDSMFDPFFARLTLDHEDDVGFVDVVTGGRPTTEQLRVYVISPVSKRRQPESGALR